MFYLSGGYQRLFAFTRTLALPPTVPDANYAISMILNEAFPAEVQGLYDAFSGAYNGGQSIMNLEPVAGF